MAKRVLALLSFACCCGIGRWFHFSVAAVMKPILVGGVFNVNNRALYAARDKMMAKVGSTNSDSGPKAGRSPKEVYSDKVRGYMLLQ